jgi:hypothetical protein
LVGVPGEKPFRDKSLPPTQAAFGRRAADIMRSAGIAQCASPGDSHATSVSVPSMALI